MHTLSVALGMRDLVVGGQRDTLHSVDRGQSTTLPPVANRLGLWTCCHSQDHPFYSLGPDSGPAEPHRSEEGGKEGGERGKEGRRDAY